MNPWHVAIEEVNQIEILATGGDIGILSVCVRGIPRLCFPSTGPPPERSTQSPSSRPSIRFAFTIMHPCFLGVQVYEIRKSLVFAASAWGELPEPVPHISHPSGINVWLACL